MNNQTWADVVVDELSRAGVCGFCVAPGSRSTPLALAVARRHGAASVVHFDERGLAWHALGWARGAGRPVAVVCTSGTAAANLLPAAVEASMSRVPLVLVTADRPPELQDCGANQTIDQRHIFGRHARAALNLPCPCPDFPLGALRSALDKLVHAARTGPVHLNCMFREPLVPEGDAAPCRGGGGDGDAPMTAWNLPVPGLSEEDERWLLNTLSGARRGLLLAGGLHNPGERDAAANLASALRWPLFPDALSGLRFMGLPSAVPCYDQLLLSPEFAGRLNPDCVLWLGGAFVSKRLNGQLSRFNCPVIQICGHDGLTDPARVVTRRFETDPAGFCRWLAPSAGFFDAPAWDMPWEALCGAVSTVVEGSTGGGLTEPAVARMVTAAMGSGSVLFLGNSMPVRDADMHGVSSGGGAWVVANRGASGIDGNIATAAGLARGADRPVAALLGDLTALHDLNSLALAAAAERPLALVVVNNGGGGIFSLLPVAGQKAHFERFFAASHGYSLKKAAEMFGIPVRQPKTQAAFGAALRRALSGKGATLIEVFTSRKENAALHASLGAKIQRVVGRML